MHPEKPALCESCYKNHDLMLYHNSQHTCHKHGDKIELEWEHSSSHYENRLRKATQKTTENKDIG